MRHPDLDQSRASLACGVVVAVALGAMDDDFGRCPLGRGQASDAGRVGSDATGGDGERDASRRAGRHVAGLVVRQLGDPLADASLELAQVDE